MAESAKRPPRTHPRRPNRERDTAPVPRLRCARGVIASTGLLGFEQWATETTSKAATPEGPGGS
jgi:hypothetical protein